MQTIYLDISNKGVSPTVYAKQGDVGRKFQVVLTDSGLPYIPVSGSAFSVWYSGASGDGNYTDIGGKSAFTVNENKVIVEMISQMLSNYGDGVLSLALNDPNGNQISTWNIPYFCEPVPGAGSEEAKNYYTAFSQAVENLPYPDASLSVSGKAADAAATGAALAGKAPAGYGLGEQDSNYISDCNSATGIGWYSLTGSTLNMPSASFYIGALRVERRGHYITQTAVAYLNEAKRNSSDGGATWNEWEYVNPPMVEGVEYRTTERYQGKAVYAILVYFGALPNNTSKALTVSALAGATGLVEMRGMVSNNGAYTPADATLGLSQVWANPGGGTIHALTTADLSSQTMFVLLKYTKD